MIDFYSRMSIARGTNLKVSSKLRLSPQEAGAEKYVWLDLIKSEKKWN